MKPPRLFSLELGRLLKSRLTWLVLLLTVLSPAAGLVLYRPAAASTMLSTYLANPALAGGVVGGVLFGLLAVYELDRTERGRFSLLVDGAVSPLMMALVRLPALMATAALGLGLTVVVWFPVSRQLIGSVFDGADYLLAYGLLMGLALWLSILAAASAYQFTRRVDLSLVLFTSFSALSLTVWAGDWQLCWLNPCVWALSDDFSNLRIFRSVAYMRLTWLAALAGIWAVSYLCEMCIRDRWTPLCRPSGRQDSGRRRMRRAISSTGRRQTRRNAPFGSGISSPTPGACRKSLSRKNWNSGGSCSLKRRRRPNEQ